MTSGARHASASRGSLHRATLIVALCPALGCAASESAREAQDARDVAVTPVAPTPPVARPAFGDADIQRAIERRFELASALPAPLGRTRMRDAAREELHCSTSEAERLVDTMVLRGFVRLSRDPLGHATWHFGGRR